MVAMLSERLRSSLRVPPASRSKKTMLMKALLATAVRRGLFVSMASELCAAGAGGAVAPEVDDTL